MKVANDNKDDFALMYMHARKMAVHLGSVGLHQPEDIAQMAIMKVLNRTDGKLPSLSWLFTVVRSVAADCWRQSEKDRRYMEPVDLETMQGAHCDSDGDQHGTFYASVPCPELAEPDVMPRLHKALAGLRAPLREVLILLADGYDYQEIATLTGTALGTVRSRIHYARKRLALLLSDLL